MLCIKINGQSTTTNGLTQTVISKPFSSQRSREQMLSSNILRVCQVFPSFLAISDNITVLLGKGLLARQSDPCSNRKTWAQRSTAWRQFRITDFFLFIIPTYIYIMQQCLIKRTQTSCWIFAACEVSISTLRPPGTNPSVFFILMSLYRLRHGQAECDVHQKGLCQWWGQ